MKRFTTINLGFILQIFAVILLFGYPGCSSIKGKQELKKDKTGLLTKKTPAAQVKSTNLKKAGDSLNLLHPWQQDATKFSLVARSRK